MGHSLDYKKEYKDLYLPKNKPSIIPIPKMKFVMVKGKGDPNTSEEYKDALSVLYGISFTIKMSKMGPIKLDGYFEYVVPPLEGLWWIDGKEFSLTNKNDLSWISMIRLPDFVTKDTFSWAKETLSPKKPDLDLSNAYYEELEEGLCIQIMHLGPYDTEEESFKTMEEYRKENGYKRVKKGIWDHHEIYLTDPRKCKSENNKVVLRYNVEKI